MTPTKDKHRTIDSTQINLLTASPPKTDTLAAQISFPTLSDTVSFSFVSLPDDKPLPSALPPRAENENGAIVGPADDPLHGSPKRRAERWDIQRAGRGLVADLKVHIRKGVDVREDTGEKRNFAQDTPLLVGCVLGGRCGSLAARGRVMRVGEVKDVQRRLVRCHRQ